MRLIDANALKKCTCEWCNTHYSDEPCEPSECIEMLRIDAQPTVDAVEVVHGRWVKTCDPDIYQCTNCKRPTKMDELCDSEILRAYCPNCGAKMDGERKDNG